MAVDRLDAVSQHHGNAQKTCGRMAVGVLMFFAIASAAAAVSKRAARSILVVNVLPSHQTGVKIGAAAFCSIRYLIVVFAATVAGLIVGATVGLTIGAAGLAAVCAPIGAAGAACGAAALICGAVTTCGAAGTG